MGAVSVGGGWYFEKKKFTGGDRHIQHGLEAALRLYYNMLKNGSYRDHCRMINAHDCYQKPASPKKEPRVETRGRDELNH